jgi:multidrug efflux pump subunit AcrA (membrane-fusion protein)
MSHVTEVVEPPAVRPASKPTAPRGRWVAALASLITGALLFGIGVAGGWTAASQTSGPAESHGHSHAGEPASGHAHAPKLTPQTLANLGVEIGELKTSEYVSTRDVPAVVAERPGTIVPASSLVAGIVEEVLVVEGQRVAAGAPVARVRRDAFPRPALVLTEAVLRPLNEEFHGSISELRSSSQALSIAREELTRVRRVLASTTESLPSKIEIDLRNEERRALRALENARQEAERHGLAAAEIAGIESGEVAAPDVPPAQRVLARNGLWSDEASTLLAALPPDVRDRPYAVAVVAELVGSRALSPEMVEAIRAQPDLAQAFLDVAGLIQQGWSVETIVALAERGALAPVVTVSAPAGAEDWDVLAVRLRPGERAEPGVTVVECRDLSRVQLELAPAGADLAAIAASLAAGETVTAEPLVADAGPALEGLRIQRLDADRDHPGEGAAIVLVENRVLSETKDGDRPFRSWAVRPGLRYIARVPLSRLPERFVLPASAVTSQGPDTVILLEDGEGFRPVAVRVEHRDSRVVVLAKDGVFPGDRVVLKGAYSVLLAIQASSGGGVDAHAGCGHAH